MSSDQMTSTEQLRRAFASTRSVLQTVHVDQLAAATPCMSWDVRALINHFIGSARWAAASISLAPQATDEDYTSVDALASYDTTIEATLAAFQGPGALDKTVALPFGEYSGAALMNLATTDQFTHGWDLARAIGQSTDLDADLADELLGRVRTEIPEAYRGPDGQGLFGPVVTPRATATAADRLAAFLGRAT